jgi:hypothetical protein
MLRERVMRGLQGWQKASGVSKRAAALELLAISTVVTHQREH